jgi:PhzF family phenazine biosynthesis protein
MTSISWVDAFTDRAFTGNPAAVCLLSTEGGAGAPMSEDRMQSLAYELGISETAFVTPVVGSDGAGGGGGGPTPDTFALRWFSPSVEIDLCGHATLASAHVLRQRGVVDGTAPLTFHTRSGPLVAAFEGDRIDLDFPTAPMTAAPLPDALVGEWDDGAVLATGTTDFFQVVVLSSEAAVRLYRPNLSAIAAADARALLITAAAEPGSDADYVLRVFGPNVGIDEDPATGSAQCAAGPYWSAALGRPDLVARQLSSRGAVLYVRPAGDRVHIAGNAVTVLAGDLC